MLNDYTPSPRLVEMKNIINLTNYSSSNQEKNSQTCHNKPNDYSPNDQTFFSFAHLFPGSVVLFPFVFVCKTHNHKKNSHYHKKRHFSHENYSEYKPNQTDNKKIIIINRSSFLCLNTNIAKTAKRIIRTPIAINIRGNAVRFIF